MTMNKKELKDAVTGGRNAMKKRLVEVLFSDIGDTIQDVVRDFDGKLDSADFEAFAIGLLDDALAIHISCFIDGDEQYPVEISLSGVGSCTTWKSATLESMVTEWMEFRSPPEFQKLIHELEHQLERLKTYKFTACNKG